MKTTPILFLAAAGIGAYFFFKKPGFNGKVVQLSDGTVAYVSGAGPLNGETIYEGTILDANGAATSTNALFAPSAVMSVVSDTPPEGASAFAAIPGWSMQDVAFSTTVLR